MKFNENLQISFRGESFENVDDGRRRLHPKGSPEPSAPWSYKHETYENLVFCSVRTLPFSIAFLHYES